MIHPPGWVNFWRSQVGQFSALVDTFTPSVNTNGDLRVLTFELTDADQVTLVADTSYAFEIFTTTAGNSDNFFYLYRSGSDLYSDGIGYTASNESSTRSRISSVNRTVAFAYTIVPEPASLAVLGLGSMMMLRRRRTA